MTGIPTPEKGLSIGAQSSADSGYSVAVQKTKLTKRIFLPYPVTEEALGDAELCAVIAHKQVGDKYLHKADYLPIDIDSKDLRKSAKTAAAVIDFSKTVHHVPGGAIRAYASGGKGFHLLIDKSVFGTAFDKLAHCLPTAFKAFAQYIVEAISADDADSTGHATVDMALYAGKTCQMLRRANILRENGFYKVPVSHDEVRAVRDAVDAEASYRALCSVPRPENWCAEVVEVPGLGDLFKRLAFDAVEKQEARVKAAKLLCAEPMDANEILGAKIVDNMVAALLHVGPDGQRVWADIADYRVWSKVAMAFDYVGCVHDCVAYAHQGFMQVSQASTGWTGPSAVYKRLDSIKHDEAQAHVTELYVFQRMRGTLFRDPNPTAKRGYKDQRNARDVLAEVVAEADKAKQRAMLLDELTVAAYEACKLAKWNELCAQVDDVAREHAVKREFSNLHKEFQAESGNVKEDDLTADARFLKWIQTVATFCMDTSDVECIIIEGEAFDLDGGAWLPKLADLWIRTTSGEVAA